MCNGRLIKDIKRLGRDLKRTIIIDDIGINFSNCKENGIEINSWTGDKSDKKLLEVMSFLKRISNKETDDVRIEIMKMRKELGDLREA